MLGRYVESCTYLGCFAKTREGKPFCIDHVLHHPYAMKIIADIEARELELAGIADGQPVNVEGPLALDVLAYLREVCSATVERIARERGYTHTAAERIVEALAGRDLVKTGRTTRGSVFAQYTGPAPDEAAGAG
jgi:hypothetical protein